MKISHKKMATKGGCIDFMFLAPLTRPLDPLLLAFLLIYGDNRPLGITNALFVDFASGDGFYSFHLCIFPMSSIT